VAAAQRGHAARACCERAPAWRPRRAYTARFAALSERGLSRAHKRPIRRAPAGRAGANTRTRIANIRTRIANIRTLSANTRSLSANTRTLSENIRTLTVSGGPPRLRRLQRTSLAAPSRRRRLTLLCACNQSVRLAGPPSLRSASGRLSSVGTAPEGARAMASGAGQAYGPPLRSAPLRSPLHLHTKSLRS
jgi:hypothetical protein